MTLDFNIFYWYISICGYFFLILSVVFIIGYLFACVIDHSSKKEEMHQKRQAIFLKRYLQINHIKKEIDDFSNEITSQQNDSGENSKSPVLLKTYEKYIDKINEIIGKSENEPSQAFCFTKIYRNRLFLHAAWAISGMLLKIQAVICFFWLCIFALGEIYEAVAPEIDLWVYAPNSKECAELTANLSYASLGILAVFTIVVASLAIVFLRKGLKYLVIQYDIVFFGYKILTYILFSEKPNKDHISEEFGELSDHLRQKNSDSFWERLFFRRSDL